METLKILCIYCKHPAGGMICTGKGYACPVCLIDALDNLEKENARLRDELDDLQNITCSMKAKCMGEFKESYEVYNELEDDYIEESRVISWPNMKDIYQMMLAQKLKENKE